MKIEELIVREIQLRLKTPFETSFGTIWKRRILLVEVRSQGLSGWGEFTAGEGPFYNSETTDTGWVVLGNFIAPLVLGKSLEQASQLPALLSPIRGHEMAKATLENALWDIEAQEKGISLAALLGGTRTEIACGVSIGIQNTPEALLAVIEKELAAGYQRIKVKIKPDRDLEFVAAARKRFPSAKLMVDANSAYRLADVEHLKRFDPYDLVMLEQPLGWDDIYEHAQLQKQIGTPVCLDECIHSARHARTAIELDACRIINIKVGRVGGHTEARFIQEVCRERAIPVWCGGMLETGIGRAHNIAMSSLAGFVLPGDVSASQRYWDEDVIEPEVEVSPKGTIRIPTIPGLGYSIKQKRIEALTVRKEICRARGSPVAVEGRT